MKKINRNWLFSLLMVGISLSNSCKKNDIPNSGIIYGTVSDIDNNVYKTIKIGTQTWMAENLKTTMFNDGSAIPNITEAATWSTLTTPGYCWYNNDLENKTKYGALYNWFTVNTGKLAPAGWHVATSDEWTILINYLANNNLTGDNLKETGTLHWDSPNSNATNETGFTALPGGYRSDTSFDYLGSLCEFWSATEENAASSWAYYISSNSAQVIGTNSPNFVGHSVRCVKD